MNWPLRIVLSALIFALVAALAERYEHEVRRLVFEWGKAAGCQYFQSGAIAVGPDGPFLGGRHCGIYNFLWRNAPWILTYLVAFIPASVVYTVTARRRPPRDGLTRCGTCGYILRGLAEPRCPECGRRI
jgi:MFS family permease